MLIFGDYSCINGLHNLNDDVIILNLSSYMEGFERVNILPPFEISHDDRNFDIMYSNYILQNDKIFSEFMKMILPIYFGSTVYVLISYDNGNMYDFVTESIQKLIQSRYGLVSNHINCIEDWDTVIETPFTLNGIYNLDIDRKRYNYINVNPEEILNTNNELDDSYVDGWF